MKTSKQNSFVAAVSNFFEHSRFFIFLLLLCLLAASLSVIIDTTPKMRNNRLPAIGQPAPYTLYADQDFTVVDHDRTEQLRKNEADKIPDHYRISGEETKRIEARYERFFKEVKKKEALEKAGGFYVHTPNDDIQEQVENLAAATQECLLRIADNPEQKKKLDLPFKKALLKGILSEPVFSNLKNKEWITIVDLNNRRYSIQAENQQIPQSCAHKIVEQALEYYTYPGKNSIIQNIARCLETVLANGNLFLDQDYTDALKKRKLKPLDDENTIRQYIHKDSLIMKKGDIVTKDIQERVKAYREQLMKTSRGLNIYKVIRENILLCLAVILAMGMYLFRVQPAFVRSNRSLWLLGLITILSLLLNKVFLEGFLRLTQHQIAIPYDMLYFALPIGLSSILVAVIFGVRTAFFVSFFVSLISALPMENQFQMVFAGLLINSGGAIAVRNVKNYRSFFVRGFLGTALSSLLVACVFYLKVNPGPELLKWLVLFPFVTGMLTAVLAQLLLYLLELVFDVNTAMSLQICADRNHPLLKELQEKAPGTYHHCESVAQLAKTAAADAGLDPIKAEVCALFHDVGKLEQPEYFTENNPGKDAHKELNDPHMSAIIIRSHVTEFGPELARKYKLKKILRDTIIQHHGTSFVGNFYQKALDAEWEKALKQAKERVLAPDQAQALAETLVQPQLEKIKVEDYRYPGPLPSDKEICLVMLADCCEAASRSMEKTQDKIETLVNSIFQNKARDGQLDNSQLTQKELAIVKKSFISTLITMNHARIATHPKEEKKYEDDLFVAAGKKVPAP